MCLPPCGRIIGRLGLCPCHLSNGCPCTCRIQILDNRLRMTVCHRNYVSEFRMAVGGHMGAVRILSISMTGALEASAGANWLY